MADDEPHGRLALREQIEQAGDFEIVAEHGNGDSALAALRAGDLDVAFLDVQMPGKTGIEVAAALGEAAPLIVFVTAFDQHAIDAFAQHALDYVLKPIDPERFTKTLARVRARLAHDEQQAGRIRQLARALIGSATTSPPRVAIETAGRTVYLRPGDFRWAVANGNYVNLRVGDGSEYSLRLTLQQLLDQVQSLGVVRVHRAYLVGLEHVRELRSSDGGHTAHLLLDGDTEIPVGRTFRADVERRLRP